MSKLSDPKESPTKAVVAEGSALVTVLGHAHSDFKFVLRSSVRHYLPIVDALVEGKVTEESAEKVVFFLQEYAPSVCTDA